ncbi:FAD dependent oxidoreductase [Bimuria novae-zelandiae CBS 107.79]|uniref:FAD dependent oxidoreductase n=1 Tax=Bimuria novae-zelandiae CBS 107.79 TaxID=1447943 RepID=A0A6A5V038_9PLEO|nr:FAD dependent oxidoreductase [Bimuria novae-zelandiae CBS 107.79]
MSRQSASKNDRINIVGTGIFGLSTALHLARRGYKHVTVFYKQPYYITQYSYFNGCDGASADINKIIRSAYGSQTEYQHLSTEAIASWKQWNSDLEHGVDVLEGMSSNDRVFIQCGSLNLTDGDALPDFERATVKNMEEAGHRNTQLVTTEREHQKIATSKGMGSAMDPFLRSNRGKPNVGVLDSTGGFAIADKACCLALHQARNFGARFVLDLIAGAFDSFVTSPNGDTIGITMKDGKQHLAALTIMACGGWTPSLLPQLDSLCEATAGSVFIYKIPRTSKLGDSLSPKQFPTWLWKVRDGVEGGLYGFPRDEEGYLKIGYRGTKYTNPKPQEDGIERSLIKILAQAMQVVRRFVPEYLPELEEEGIDVALTRVCWYTDSFDNHFVIDHVPNKRGLFVTTGRSGHAFKYLPNIGNWIDDAIEGVGSTRPAIQAWKWRRLEGAKGARALANVPLVDTRVTTGRTADDIAFGIKYLKTRDIECTEPMKRIIGLSAAN